MTSGRSHGGSAHEIDEDVLFSFRVRIEELMRGVAWWSDVHQFAADRWGTLNYGLGLPIVILSAVASTSALASFDRSNVVAGILALVVAVLSALATFLNAQKASELHRTASTNYLSLGFRAKALNDDLRLGLSEANAHKRIRELEDERAKLLRDSPTYSARIRRLAEKRREQERAAAVQAGAVPAPPPDL